MKLNLGCGDDIKPGWINLDRSGNKYVDVVHDLNKTPLPFVDNCFDYILASHIFEHLLEWEKVLIDCHRILKPGGLLEVRVPDWLRGIRYPYHVRLFAPDTMAYFLVDDESYSNEPRVKFELVKMRRDRDSPIHYHLKKYLGIETQFPRIRNWQIVWIMRKPTVEGD